MSKIAVIYSWTAKAGQAEALKDIYKEVSVQMEETEPGTMKVGCFFEDETQKLVVIDIFEDGAALGQHLGVTAAAHFPSLLAIADPGAFLFCGDVPNELKQAALSMGLNATFAPFAFGFDRSAA